MLNRIIYLPLIFAVLAISCMSSQKIEVSKSQQGFQATNTYIYCLPKTRIDIDISVTKTILKKGPYAEYAGKYLSISDVPLVNSEVFEITDVHFLPVNEPDPDQYYAVNYKNYPANLDKLYSVSRLGLMLDFQKSWQETHEEIPSLYSTTDVPFTRNIYSPNIKEHVDTLYKTILTDSSFVKVPVYKKTMQVKNDDDRAKEMAERLLKVQKRKLKISMGNTDYRLDGTALKTVLDELSKQEHELLALFIGKKITQTIHYRFSQYPGNKGPKEIAWFSPDKGLLDTPFAGAAAITFNAVSNNAVAQDIEVKIPEKITNQIYYRAPIVSSVSLKSGNLTLIESKIPVFQMGKIMTIPVSR